MWLGGVGLERLSLTLSVRSKHGRKGWGADVTPHLFERSTGFLLRGFWGNPHEIRVLQDFFDFL